MIGLLRKKKEVPFQAWHAWLLLGVVIVAVVLSIVQHASQRTTPAAVVIMSQSTCEAAGGDWNPCASACPGSTEPCIEVCVARCECATNDTCPSGWMCEKQPDQQFVCINSSQQ